MTKQIKVLEYNTGAKAVSEWPEEKVTIVSDGYFYPETNPNCPEFASFGTGDDGEKMYNVYKAWYISNPDKFWFVAKAQ